MMPCFCNARQVDVLERCLDGLPGQQEWSQQAQSHGLQAAIHGLGQPPGGWSLEVRIPVPILLAIGADGEL